MTSMADVSIDEAVGRLKWPASGSFRLNPTQLTLMRALLVRPRSYDQLIQLLWGDDPNGGPDGAPNTLKVHISKLRFALAEAGCPVTIVTNRGIGFQLGPFTTDAPSTDAPSTEESRPMGFQDLSPPVEGADSKIKFSPYKQGRTKITIGAGLMKAAGLAKGTRVRVQVDLMAKQRMLRVFADEKGLFALKGSRGGIGMIVISNGSLPALTDKTPADGANSGDYIDIVLPEIWQHQAVQPVAAPIDAVTKPAPTMVNGRPTQNHPWRNNKAQAA